MKQDKHIREFIAESNAIEREYSNEAFEDAMTAWDYIKRQSSISVMDILNTHQILMKRLRPDIAGRIRDCDVYIGGERRAFLGEEVIKSQLDAWCREMNLIVTVHKQNSLDETNRIGTTKRLHVDYEKVHPFEDGNGRTGRIFYNWHRLKLGLPIHVIHEGDEQLEYYRWFQS